MILNNGIGYCDLRIEIDNSNGLFIPTTFDIRLINDKPAILRNNPRVKIISNFIDFFPKLKLTLIKRDI